MFVSLGNSKRIARDFVMAETRSAKMATMTCSERMKASTTEEMAKATAALQEDPIAQQLLPMAREYNRLKHERRKAINDTLLGGVNAAIDAILEGQQPGEEDYKDTTIDDEWKELVRSLDAVEDPHRQRIYAALSNLLGSLVVDVANTELPPLPKFTI